MKVESRWMLIESFPFHSFYSLLLLLFSLTSSFVLIRLFICYAMNDTAIEGLAINLFNVQLRHTVYTKVPNYTNMICFFFFKYVVVCRLSFPFHSKFNFLRWSINMEHTIDRSRQWFNIFQSDCIYLPVCLYPFGNRFK